MCMCVCACVCLCVCVVAGWRETLQIAQNIVGEEIAGGAEKVGNLRDVPAAVAEPQSGDGVGNMAEKVAEGSRPRRCKH